MKRTTIFLDEGLLHRTRRFASRRGISFAEVVRRAVSSYLAAGEERDEPGVPSIAGGFTSGHTDTSAQVDELLWKDPHR